MRHPDQLVWLGFLHLLKNGQEQSGNLPDGIPEGRVLELFNDD